MELLDGSYASAALGAALELGLFWRLSERPLDAEGIAGAYGIPLNRCRYWLQLLERTGLLERTEAGFAPSAAAHDAILAALSRESWEQLAVESREAFPGLRDLSVHLRTPGSAFEAMGYTPPDYLALMSADRARARRFTRMLYEIHAAFAARLAAFLDCEGAARLLDIGGGSGVVSLALARRHPRLTAVVLDLPAVCAAGREIAAECGLSGRVAFHAADFREDALPVGFDAAIECDVGVYDAGLFGKVRAALNPGGRFFVVDQFAPAVGVAPATRVQWALDGALRDPSFAFETAAEVSAQLERADFVAVTARPLPPAASIPERFARDYTVIAAQAPPSP
jgi:SAM-dependent methyltransferase